MLRCHVIGLTVMIAVATRGLAADPPPAAPAEAPAGAKKGDFTPPYPLRTNPFKQPDNKAALAARRESSQQQSNLRLKGFVHVGTLRAVVEIDGQLTMLSTGQRHGDLEVLEVTPTSLTLQRGRYRWTETLAEAVRAATAG
jgi:hypothetical protein